MQDYGVRDVERLLGISRGTIRALLDAGFVKPTRGARNALRFSFQDLIVLRTAQALVKANVPRRRIVRSLRELRVVREGERRWLAESGQYLLAFEGDPSKGKLNVIEREPGARGREAPSPEITDEDAQEWIDQAAELEGDDPQGAIAAYQKAIDVDPSRLDARINLGRLLHESRRLTKAEEVYRAALDACGSEALLLFNLGVLLDDMNRRAAAIEAYTAALFEDPSLADAHYNLALLYRQSGKPREAIRHLAQYRKLKA